MPKQKITRAQVMELLNDKHNKSTVDLTDDLDSIDSVSDISTTNNAKKYEEVEGRVALNEQQYNEIKIRAHLYKPLTVHEVKGEKGSPSTYHLFIPENAKLSDKQIERLKELPIVLEDPKKAEISRLMGVPIDKIKTEFNMETKENEYLLPVTEAQIKAIGATNFEIAKDEGEDQKYMRIPTTITNPAEQRELKRIQDKINPPKWSNLTRALIAILFIVLVLAIVAGIASGFGVPVVPFLMAAAVHIAPIAIAALHSFFVSTIPAFSTHLGLGIGAGVVSHGAALGIGTGTSMQVGMQAASLGIVGTTALVATGATVYGVRKALSPTVPKNDAATPPPINPLLGPIKRAVKQSLDEVPNYPPPQPPVHRI